MERNIKVNITAAGISFAMTGLEVWHVCGRMGYTPSHGLQMLCRAFAENAGAIMGIALETSIDLCDMLKLCKPSDAVNWLYAMNAAHHSLQCVAA